MNTPLSAFSFRPFGFARRSPPEPRRGERPVTTPLQDDDRADPTERDTRERPAPGCGWFDSSHELQCGLQVQELGPHQLDAQALPAAVWLELHTAGSAAGGSLTARW